MRFQIKNQQGYLRIAKFLRILIFLRIITGGQAGKLIKKHMKKYDKK